MHQRPNFERFKPQDRLSVPAVDLSDLTIQQLLARGRRERSRQAVALFGRLWRTLTGRR